MKRYNIQFTEKQLDFIRYALNMVIEMNSGFSEYQSDSRYSQNLINKIDKDRAKIDAAAPIDHSAAEKIIAKMVNGQ